MCCGLWRNLESGKDKFHFSKSADLSDDNFLLSASIQYGCDEFALPSINYLRKRYI